MPSSVDIYTQGNQLQRTVNIALGSATSTIGMTVPTALVIAFLTKQNIELGLENLQITELMLTLVTCLLTFGTGKTNYLQGLVHLVLFVSCKRRCTAACIPPIFTEKWPLVNAFEPTTALLVVADIFLIFD